MVGYLCRANPYSCIGSCYNQPNFTDASKVSCFYSCVNGTTDSGNCVHLDTDSLSVPCDSLSSGGVIEFSPSAVDSLNQFFLDGFGGGIVFTLPYLGSLFFILLACFLFVSAARNS